MGLNQQQKAAVEYLDGPLLVLAGPGTGKTQLLSAKVAYILQNTDTNPENILCITFTESGASNMRERLGTMIGQAAAKVNIFTYHAFGSNIIERFQNYAEHLDRTLDSPIDGVAQYKIIRDIRDHLPAMDILKTAKIQDLIDTIQHAKSARLSAADLAKIAKTNIADSSGLAAEISPILEQLVPRMRFDKAVDKVYQPILTVLTKYSSPTPIAGNIEPIANSMARELASLITTESAKDKPSVSPFTGWRNKNFEKIDDGSWRLKDYIKNKKLASLANVMQKYTDYLHTEGLYDFADMIEEAIRALKEERGFRLTLSEIFQYILLDEFQDTNPSQFELIKLLTDYEQPNVMAVGDDDQAIFEFQGANASNLLDFQEHYHAKVITLVDNYRSTSEILNFSHRVAEQVEDSFAKKHQVAKILRSMRDIFAQEAQTQSSQTTQASQTLQTSTRFATTDSTQSIITNDKSQIERHEFDHADNEYAWIACRIEELIQSGEAASDIAIIAPKHKYIAPLLPFLKAHHIDISYEKKSSLFEDAKIHELIVLANFIDDIANERRPEHRLLEILSFPFLAVDPLDAINATSAIRQQNKNPLEALKNSDQQCLQDIAQWLAALVMQSYAVPLELWLDYAIGMQTIPGLDFTSPYFSYYQTHGTDIEQLEFFQNLTILRNTASTYGENPQPKLTDFVKMLTDYAEAEINISSSTIMSDAENAVQVMSSHKSKGLEFKYVFMIAVDDNAWGKAKGNNTTFSLPNNLLQIRHTGITDDERLRLLFVAITRARDHLIMTNSVTDFTGKTVNRLRYLGELRDDKNSTPNSLYLPLDTQAIQLHQDFQITERIDNVRNHWVAAYQVLSPNLKLLLQTRLDKYRLTASDLTSFIDIIFAGPQEVYRRRILQAPDEPLTSSLAYGNLIHATFEQITNQQISDATAQEFYHQKASELPFTTQEIQDLQDKGSESLEIALHDFGTLLRATGAKAEVNLHSEHPVLNGVPLTGKLDHIAIDDQTKTIEIYDFKTGKYHEGKWDSKPNLYKYRLQLGFYKLLLNLSPSYAKYRVTKGHILFVSPDQDKKVYDKVYEYNDVDEEELKRLIEAVYYQIKTLDFIEDAELNLTADKNRKQKDVVAFVEKLLSLPKTA